MGESRVVIVRRLPQSPVSEQTTVVSQAEPSRRAAWAAAR